MEIIRTSIVSPYRLHAFLRLVARIQPTDRQTLADLLQPLELDTSKEQKAFDDVFLAARNLNLIEERSSNGEIRLHSSLSSIEQLENFRKTVQDRFIGITDRQADNYLLNLFTSWYAVQDEWVVTNPRREWERRFNEELGDFLGATRPINETNIRSWLNWAFFLGWGWPFKIDTSEVLAPDATGRLTHALPKLLQYEEDVVPFGEFAYRIKMYCPELDGGDLFERCWHYSRGAEDRGNRLSLMLSTGLRVLEKAGQIELIEIPDSPAIWQLFPAHGHVNVVTHVRRMG